MRKKLLSMLVLLTAAAPGAWAQDEVTLTPQGGSAWTLVMPASNVELEVTYFTQAELDQQAAEDVVTKINAIGEVAYTEECKARIDAAPPPRRTDGRPPFRSLSAFSSASAWRQGIL